MLNNLEFNTFHLIQQALKYNQTFKHFFKLPFGTRHTSPNYLNCSAIVYYVVHYQDLIYKIDITNTLNFILFVYIKAVLGNKGLDITVYPTFF